MKFERTQRFDSDLSALPREHQVQFRSVVAEFHDACESFINVQNSARTQGSWKWPHRLRVRRMASAPGIWEMTWSFSSPDGRATFAFVHRNGETRVLWRRIGNHGIYRNP